MSAQCVALSRHEEAESLRRHVGASAPHPDALSIARHDIDFFNVSPERIAVQIRVTNAGDEPSAAARVAVQAAPFGAFVPWRPLTMLTLPPLAPGQVVYLRTVASVVRRAPLGSADRLPPRALLTALDLADEPPPQPGRQRGAVQTRAPVMPPDLMQLLLQETPHWIGNLNVLVGKTDVERHQALALRVYPGRLNMAWFIVGSGGRDAYAFRLEGCGNDWDAKLFNMTSRETLVLNVADNAAITPERWIPSNGTQIMMLALRPPHGCGAGKIEVHVSQQSDGRTAVVEFSLDPKAAGRGCYVV